MWLDMAVPFLESSVSVSRNGERNYIGGKKDIENNPASSLKRSASIETIKNCSKIFESRRILRNKYFKMRTVHLLTDYGTKWFNIQDIRCALCTQSSIVTELYIH